jgi:hypothetical protein
MGVLRQKCVPTYEAFLNNSNFSSIGLNMSYESYLKEINYPSRLKNLLFKIKAIFKTGCDLLLITY